MDSEAITLVLGFFLGLATNFIVWGLLFHYFVPRVRFSPHISKVPNKKTREDKSGFRYRFKIENAGRRDIIDVDLAARLSVKGLRTPSIWSTIYIPLSADGDSSYRIPLLRPAKKGKIARRKVMFFYTNSRDVLRDWSIFPEKLRRRSRNRTLLLEDLMKLGSKANPEIHAYCYDSFSGSRKLFISRPYSTDEILSGVFEAAGLGVLKGTLPVPSPQSTEEGEE